MYHGSHSRTPVVLLIIFLIALGAAYTLALPGYLLFDEDPNLAGLATIDDLQSWLDFVTSGRAGPFGRPISLASFAFQSHAWPDDTSSFLRANIVIHLLNSFLVFLIATGLANLRPKSPPATSLWIGLITAMLWGASPFLATSSLMIIQRMTTLAGFFVFAGLAAFVWAHNQSFRTLRLRWSLFIIFSACIPLAVYSKENGALLPLLAAIVYLFWLPADKRHTGKPDLIFYIFVVAIPATMVLLYIGFRTPEILSSGYGPTRYFTPEERLLTQPFILLDYIKNILLPRAAAASPFTDHFPAATGFLTTPVSALSMIIWMVALAAALAFRSTAPWLIFGLSFFLCAHLIESSVFGLELYFSHRNYVPSFGIYFGLAYALLSVPSRYSKIASTGLVLYATLSFSILIQTTANWSDIFPNALAWQEEHPYSERAAQFLANQYLERGSPQGARQSLDDLAARSPQLALTQIMRTQFCFGKELEFEALLDEVIDSLKTSRLYLYAPLELVKATRDESHRSTYCTARDMRALALMAEALLANSAYSEHARSLAALEYVVSVFAEQETKIDSLLPTEPR